MVMDISETIKAETTYDQSLKTDCIKKINEVKHEKYIALNV